MWLQASDSPFTLSAEELDMKVKKNIKGENRYLDGKTISSSSTLSKAVRKSYGPIPFNLISSCTLVHFNCFSVSIWIANDSNCYSDRLDNETQVYTEGSARFIYGYGSALKQNRAWEVELIDIIKTESGT